MIHCQTRIVEVEEIILLFEDEISRHAQKRAIIVLIRNTEDESTGGPFFRLSKRYGRSCRNDTPGIQRRLGLEKIQILLIEPTQFKYTAQTTTENPCSNASL